MIRRGELLTGLGHLRCFTDSPDSALDLLEYQCTCIETQEPPGLSSAHLTYPRLYFLAVLWRFHDLEPPLLRNGRRITFQLEERHEPNGSRRSVLPPSIVRFSSLNQTTY